jgi:hypothetical protein
VSAVSRYRAIGVAGFRVAFGLWDALAHFLAPKNLARLSFEADHLPGLRAIVIRRLDIAVEADLEFGLPFLGHCGRDEDTISPDDRTG